MIVRLANAPLEQDSLPLVRKLQYQMSAEWKLRCLAEEYDELVDLLVNRQDRLIRSIEKQDIVDELEDLRDNSWDIVDSEYDDEDDEDDDEDDEDSAFGEEPCPYEQVCTVN